MSEQQGWDQPPVAQAQQHMPTNHVPPHVPHMQHPPQWYPPSSPYVTPAAAVPAPFKRRRLGTGVVAVVAAVALSAASAIGGGVAALELRPATASSTVVTAQNSSGSKSANLADVAAAVLPSVVSINTGTAVGSGVIITTDGAVLTNNHVVATARGNTVELTFSDGKSATAQVVGTDPSSDLAVVKITGGGTYTPLAFADSSNVHVGDTVLAVGSPLGLEASVTSGIVSALNRTIDESGDSGQGGRGAMTSTGAKITGAIQTDAAINPGNSGGALVNTAGQLIGINTAIASTSQTAGNIGVGFAISSNTAKAVAQQLLS
ncbi:S1C family serine protease [Dactylosporangium sp. CA-233914]|uniref:S1C family serine protease n=1 Tax=Dactylosporangium sp. CA-233914 TaxID=3239934 RepID=UPI003D8F4A12